MKTLNHLSISVVLFSQLLLSGCGKSTTPGMSKVSLQLGQYSAFNRILSWVVPEARAAVTSARFCFKRVRFKTEEEFHSNTHSSSGDDTGSDDSNAINDDTHHTEDDSENVDFTPGEIDISSVGSVIGEVSLPEGTYSRVEFDLEKDGPGCTSSKSAEVINSQGMFSTQERITIKFEGKFIASEANQVLSLGVDNILAALDAVNNASEIKAKLENAGVKGSF